MTMTNCSRASGARYCQLKATIWSILILAVTVAIDMCAHREPAYVSFPLCHPLPESERAQDRSLLIPLFTQMTEDDQDYVVDCLHKILNATA